MTEAKTKTNAKAKNTEEIPDPAVEETPEELVVVNASEWRKNNFNVRDIKLPSGLVVKVQNISLPNLATTGSLPLPLLTKFLDMKNKLSNVKGDNPEEALGSFGTVDVVAFNNMLDKVCLKAIILPKVTGEDTGEENTIPVCEIEFTDKAHIFMSCIRGGAEAFASFLG